MKILQYIVLFFFFVLLCCKGYQAIYEGPGIDKTGVLVILLIALVLLKRGWIYWWLGLFLVSYGLYNFLFIRIWAAEPTAMEFTSSLNYFLFGRRTGNYVHHIIVLIPFVFYLVSLILLLTKAGRKYYFNTVKS
ncbi:hypothetical protein [Chitinophaga sp.]|uniref:hypothetical protein n=1 Tax=Chitinophaga sp. TaxID=1869181 RepID=UPI002F929C44